MAICFTRWPQCLLSEQSTLSGAAIATGTESVETHRQTIAKATCRGRDNMRMR
jgi:hypothetical protein